MFVGKITGIPLYTLILPAPAIPHRPTRSICSVRVHPTWSFEFFGVAVVYLPSEWFAHRSAYYCSAGCLPVNTSKNMVRAVRSIGGRIGCQSTPPYGSLEVTVNSFDYLVHVILVQVVRTMRLENPIIHHLSDLRSSVSGIVQVHHDAVSYVSSAGFKILIVSHILESYGAVARPWLIILPICCPGTCGGSPSTPIR